VAVERSELPDGAPGLIVANPPYGRRLAPRALGEIYRAIGAVARRRGWRLALLAPSDELARLAGRPSRRQPLVNGGVRVGLFSYG
jgi:putative N6-adenine-specific DNA methylase